jgi:hypothetical protein
MDKNKSIYFFMDVILNYSCIKILLFNNKSMISFKRQKGLVEVVQFKKYRDADSPGAQRVAETDIKKH